MHEIREFFVNLFGLDHPDPTALHMIARAVLLYGTTLLMIRLGDKRLLGKNSAFDVILGVIIGSAVSRAINGSTAVFATIAAVFVLLLLHYVFSSLAFTSRKTDQVVKGKVLPLVKNGEFIYNNLKKSHITHEDFFEQLRLSKGTENTENLEWAYLERNGRISFHFRECVKNAEVKDITVENGVKKVKIVINDKNR